MDALTLFFLTSGLFLGWSLGSNDAANIFGTAVGTKMIRFRTALIVGAVFVILGAVVSGAGASRGLGELGSINALPGAFIVALAAAVTVFGMTKVGLPVSTTQAVVGALVGWNFFSGFYTDPGVLSKIVGTWVACPILGAGFAILLYRGTRALVRYSKVHMFRLDLYTRVGLILAGAFGAYSLGANNVANVMGVFVPTTPFPSTELFGVQISSAQKLFFLGGASIAVGIFYSRKVMMTVGKNLLAVNPVGAWVAVVSHSLVLFVFSSRALRDALVGIGLPPIPLIPVSSSQAVVGAVIGIGLSNGFRGVRQVKWKILLHIASGWVSTPIIAALTSFVLLFVAQNVFELRVYKEVNYRLDDSVLEHLEAKGVSTDQLADLEGRTILGSKRYGNWLSGQTDLESEEIMHVIEASRLLNLNVGSRDIYSLEQEMFSSDQWNAVRSLQGKSFDYRWQVREALEAASGSWRPPAESEGKDKERQEIEDLFDYLIRKLTAREQQYMLQPREEGFP